MPKPPKKKGFQTSLCKTEAGIAWETIAMAMVEGLEKQLSPPEKKSTLLKRFCPRPFAKCPQPHPVPAQRCLAPFPPTGVCNRRAVPCTDAAQELCPHGKGGQQHPWIRSAPCSLPQPQAAVPCRTQGGNTPYGWSYLPVCVFCGEEDIRVVLGREGAIRDRDILPPSIQLMKTPS